MALSEPGTGLEPYMLQCASKRFFEFDCPGCGLQRSINFLIQGEFAQAFWMYPAIYPLLTLFGFLAISRMVKIRYEQAITMVLAYATVFLILANFFYKLLN